MPNYQEPIDERDLSMEDKFKLEKKELPNEKVESGVSKVEKEKPKEMARAEKENAYGKILSKIKGHHIQAQDKDTEIKEDAENFFKNTDADSQIQHLVDMAMNKGVIHAVKVARHLDDNYVLDMFHDKLLADEFHDALVKKGLIEEI